VLDPCHTLYSSLKFGAGGVIGSSVSGCVWQGLGPQFSFAAALGALVARRVDDSRYEY